jgi:hypothetical protein
MKKLIIALILTFISVSLTTIVPMTPGFALPIDISDSQVVYKAEDRFLMGNINVPGARGWAEFRWNGKKNAFYPGEYGLYHELVNEDFESYNPGTFPEEGGWELVYNGKGDQYNVVQDSVFSSHSNAMVMQGRTGWSAVMQYKLSDPPSRIYLSGRMRCESLSSSGDINLWNREESTWGYCYCRIFFKEVDEQWYLALGFTEDLQDRILVPVMNTEFNWYDFTLCYDSVNFTATVWIDGKIAAEDVPMRKGDLGYNAIILGVGHEGVKFFFDDIRAWYKEEQ